VLSPKCATLSIVAMISLASITAVHADGSPMTMKPNHGVSFDVGAKRAVAYFLSESGTCQLVLTLANKPSWGGVTSFTATRFEAAVPALKETQFRSTEGKVIEFECHADAKKMSVKTVDQIADKRTK
jgi:hypothetical protein